MNCGEPLGSPETSLEDVWVYLKAGLDFAEGCGQVDAYSTIIGVVRLASVGLA